MATIGTERNCPDLEWQEEDLTLYPHLTVQHFTLHIQLYIFILNQCLHWSISNSH